MKNGNAPVIPAVEVRILMLAVLCAVVTLFFALFSLGWFGNVSAQEGPACDTIELGALGIEPEGELTADGRWTTEDCDSRFRPGSDAYTYRFSVTEEGRVRIDLKSAEGDSYLYLLNEDGSRIADNDDGGAGVNARVERDLAPGTYLVEATTVGGRKRGAADFSLSISYVAGCDPVHLGSLTPGTDLTASGSWTIDTCGSRFVVEHPAHGYLFDLPEDGRVRIDLTSENGDPVLSLVSLTEGLISANDDGGDGRNSRIERYLQAGTYLLEATTYLERDYQPLRADFDLVVHLVDENARLDFPLIKIEAVHTPERVVAGQPFDVHFRIGNVGDGSLADIGGSAFTYVVGPRVFQGPIFVTGPEDRWQAGASYHTGEQTAIAQSIETKAVQPFEVTFNRPGPTWLFVAVITEDSSEEEVGFYGLWQNLMVLSGTTFDEVKVEVDDIEYSVEAEADEEGIVTTTVTSGTDEDAEIDPSVRAKAIYAAGVHTQVLDGIFDEPELAGLSTTGRSTPVTLEGVSSEALLKGFAAEYKSAIDASGLADSLDAEEALSPIDIEDVVLANAQTASGHFVSLAANWTSLQTKILLREPISFEEARDLHAQFSYAERVLSPAVAAGEAVGASRDADEGWNDSDVQAMVDDLMDRTACGNRTADLRSVFEEEGTTDFAALATLDAEMRAASPIFGLRNDAVLCAVGEADNENFRFLRGLAISDNRELLEALGYPQAAEPTAAPPHRLRIIARLAEDGRIEHGIELASGVQMVPSIRFLTTDSPAGEWKVSSDVTADNAPIGRIQSRRLADGRVEVAFITASGEIITPNPRFLSADLPTGVWLRSGEFSVPSGQSLE